MNEYDVIVIGSGAGMLIVERSVTAGLTVALSNRKGTARRYVPECGLHTLEDADPSCGPHRSD
jgi:predicted flavoprotein YhiN